MAPAAAADTRGSCGFEPPASPSDRLVQTEVAGVDVNVLLPAGYTEEPQRQYPVLYLLHGAVFDENTWLNRTDISAFTATTSPDQEAIVVIPDGGPFSFYADWRDGSEVWETFFLEDLLPYVDAHFRTLADGSQRAIAGQSMGGYGATHLAARHPELFAAVGSFSGIVDIRYGSPGTEIIGLGVTLGQKRCAGRFGGEPWGPFGDPVTNELGWRSHNPVDLAANLGGLAVYVASGDGVPCDPSDLQALQEGPLPPLIERGVLEMSRSFDAALEAAGAGHTRDFYGCGLHSMRYAQRDLHAFWTVMFNAFDRATPASFDYRSADPAFSAWGWSFTADPLRSPELLDVTDASRQDVTLTGSGDTAVTTAPLFAPGERVELEGASEPAAVADGSGRLSFTVSLGPASQTQQYTPERRLDDHAPVTRTVRFSPG